MKDDKPLVSIVIPVHNGEKYIKESINSCINQTYPTLEIIVVDDKSTDNTLEILKEYSNQITVIL
jgi:glycosyltransferase involved in cell wall biosynthesis